MGEKGNTTHTCIMSGNAEAMEKSKVGTEKESLEGEGRQILLGKASLTLPC